MFKNVTSNMADDKFLEIYKQHRTAQDKHTYFLLAAAGAAIALVFNQTKGTALSWSQIPLAIATLSWGLSFFFGCRHLNYISSTLYANGELLRVQKGIHPTSGNHPELMAAASEGIREAIESNSDWANSLGHLQFRFLIAGAIFFITWHIIEMWLHTIV